MNCLKTGATIFNRSTQSGTRIDLFINGTSLFINKNIWTNCKEDSCEFDVIVDSLEEVSGFTNKRLVNPTVSASLIEYVSGPYAGIAEELFLSIYK